MPKIYLSPPYHYWNQCCYSSTCNETDHGNAYCDEIQVYLLASGFEVARGTRRTPKSSEDGTVLMKRAVAESNTWGADLHYITHSNASNGTVKGSRPMWYTGSTTGKAIVDKIVEYRKKIYPYSITPYADNQWYELYKTNAPAVYEELVFHDNAEDANWFHNNMRLLAEYSARAICDYFGVAFVDPYYVVPQPEPETPTQPTTPDLPVYNRIRGDINGDGKITAADALIALQASVQKITLTEAQKAAADMDSDGDIDATDALTALQKSVNK